ncbi:MAG: flagellin [Nitrospirae bacterium]|nr:flagellin [Nitrospirota bacterium]
MSLRINNNIAAFNAHRSLGGSDDMLSKSLEKLSSGYKINRAGDDAAGLGISESLRANIRSFKKASDNTSQAMAILQVAEGGANEVGNILQRLKELATQASSANLTSTDRTKLNDEATQLEQEIDRIANSTKYGSNTLINGNFGATASIGSQNLVTAGIASAAKIDVSGVVDTSATYTITDAGDNTIALWNGSITQTITLSGTGAQTLDFKSLGVKITLDSNYSVSNELNAAYFTVVAGTQDFQVGASSSSDDRISLAIGNLKTSSLKDGATFDVTLTSAASAQSALSDIDTAISYVTTKRGDIGAKQNRLQFAASNLAATIENTIAADSIIRDADMAFEMTSFTKNQVLMQAGNAMLAQANMTPQMVLKLLG